MSFKIMRSHLRSHKFRLTIFSILIPLLSGILFGSKNALAEGMIHTLTLPIYGQISSDSFHDRAEAMATTYIDSQFTQDLAINGIQLVVLGQKSAEIVPVFSISVTRDQWQKHSQVNHWATYTRVSYALLQRPRPEFNPSQTATNSRSVENITDQEKRRTFPEPLSPPSEAEIMANPQRYISLLD
jgi:hypothetical protein